MSTKKVIKFGRLVGWDDGPTGTTLAILGDVKNHYRLGDQPLVTTSSVVKIDRDADNRIVRIETLNTIYERE